MKHKIGKVLTALVFSVGMVGVATTAHAGGWTMISASAGLPKDKTMSYGFGLSGAVIAMPGKSSLSWIIPIPNNTGMNGIPGNFTILDFGSCPSVCSGGGFAVDNLGNYEAITNTVQFSSNISTSRAVAFGADFQKTGFTYVNFWMDLGSTGVGIGVEYYQE